MFLCQIFISVTKKWYFCNLITSEKLSKLVFVNNHYLLFSKIGIITMHGYYHYKYMKTHEDTDTDFFYKLVACKTG